MPPAIFRIITMAKNTGKQGKAISDEAMERLAQLMNDTPTLIKLKGTEFEIKALKPGTQWLIAEEACKIIKQEKMSMGDVIKELASNLPSVAKIITLAILNDKERIKKDYESVYDSIMWGDYDQRDWLYLLVEIMKLLDVDFFFASTNLIETLRQQTLSRKMMTEEQK